MSKTERKITLILEDDWWVAKDERVGIASQGKTKKEALENLEEAVELAKESIEDDTPAPKPDAPWFEE